MFKPHVDYSMDTTVPHSKGGEIEAVKMAAKRHDLYMESRNVGQSKYALWIKVHEDFILILMFPQTIKHLVHSKCSKPYLCFLHTLSFNWSNCLTHDT